VKNLRWIGLGVLCLVACKKPESTETTTRKEQPAAAATVAATQQNADAGASSAPPVSPASSPIPVISGSAPASFANGKKEVVEGAVGLGCEAKSSEGWLEFLCRKKNGTGGRPVRAVLNAETNEEVLADEHGELKLTLPFRDGESKDVSMEWSDTRYVLHIDGATAKLEWAASALEHRRACAKLLDESKQVVTAAQKVDGQARVLAADLVKFPRFGVCQPAGLGSWALALNELSASGESGQRAVRVSLSVVRIDVEGKRLVAPFANVEFAPGGFEISGMQAYDYNDDGNNELIIGYELKALAGRQATALPAIWSFSASGVAPYEKAPALTSGGALIEQLEFDMRPDVADYGPFVSWFGADCGLKNCPQRLTGPRFFFRSLPDGSFSREDASPKAALKRVCPKKPEVIVVESGGALNATQTAKNLGCARAYGVTTDVIVAELAAKQQALCGDAAACPLKSAFETWARANAPMTL
jgi:hypothetical protein